MTETKLFPGVTQEQIDNSKRAAKLKAAQKAMAEEASRKEKQIKQEEEEKIKKIDRANSDIRKKLIEHLVGVSVKSALGASIASAILGLCASSMTWTEIDAKNDIGQPIKVPHVIIDFDSEQMISGYSYDYAKNHDMLFSFFANLLMTSVLFIGYAKSLIKNPKLGQEYKNRDTAAKILAKTNLSFKEIEEAIEKSDKKAITDIIQNLSKQDRKFFDEFIAEPNNITKQEIAIAIVKGHIMTHPNDLDKLFTAFAPESIPQEIRQTYEKHKKSKTLSWEQAVFQYNNQGEYK